MAAPVVPETDTSHRPNGSQWIAAAEEEGAGSMRFSLKEVTDPYGKVGTSNVMAGSYHC